MHSSTSARTPDSMMQYDLLMQAIALEAASTAAGEEQSLMGEMKQKDAICIT